MTPFPVSWAATGALGWAALLIALATVGLATSYARRGRARPVRAAACVMKASAILLLAACLAEPLATGTRPRPGSNLFLVVADNSASLQIGAGGTTRGQRLRTRLAAASPWLARLGQDFEVRRYLFDANVRPVNSFDALTFDGGVSGLNGALATLIERFRNQPVAGILLLTDGNATDEPGPPRLPDDAPPVYTVPADDDAGLVDLSVSRVAVTQTAFEAAPVTITATLEGRGLGERPVVVRVIDDSGREIERRTLARLPDAQPAAERFLLRPEQTGISFYTVEANLTDARGAAPPEATLLNNRRIAAVDRGGGPYRVLYVSGRPNWEFKFLRRAMQEDDEINLVALVRVARREPKFTFLGRPGERTNPLFRGFGNQADEAAEQYDQPVLIRLNTESQDELRGGFPKNVEDLFRYHAVILDDVEAGFFTHDQLSLLQQFVGRRGGGFLMLGGKDSLAQGDYQRTPVGEMLPVYLGRAGNDAAAAAYSLVLTREGWLQPWVRLRTNENDERQRLQAMPAFSTLNRVEAIKPGAAVLAQVAAADGAPLPALVVQQFGRGRTAALLVGDLWRWNLHRPDATQSDLEKSWRQMLRWLVSDVPAQVEVEVSQPRDAAAEIIVRTRDAQFEPLDNVKVAVQVKTPEGRVVELAAESSDRTPGQYTAAFAPREPGAYRAQIVATAADGSEVGRRETGWAAEPQAGEFRTLAVNHEALERIARDTGGEVVPPNSLEQFVASLPNRKIPVVESWTYPLWHQWPVFAAALGLLIGEWSLRRWNGLP